MRERLASGLPWVPACLLGGLLALHLGGVAAGGMYRVVAWLFLVQLVPLPSLLLLVGAAAVGVVRRQLGPATALTAGLGLLGALPALSGWGVWPVRYPSSLAGTAPSVAVRVPTDRPMVVAWGGDALETNYHAFDAAQRWAYDLVVTPAGHGATRLEDYGCYGVPVLAPAAGVVSHVEDGLPEQVPGQFVPDYLKPAGNHVALRLADTGTYLVLAHFQPGSVAVRRGESVVEGQRLGLCGSSGNSSEPHVHLHHQRQDPAVLGLLSEGLPLYFRDHEGPPMPHGGVEVAGEVARFVGEVVAHRGAPPDP